MGLGTHCSKIDGFPGIHGTHANEATDYECEFTYTWTDVKVEKMIHILVRAFDFSAFKIKYSRT